jgi:nucleotide-binding universal stress UspA family protein
MSSPSGIARFLKTKEEKKAESNAKKAEKARKEQRKEDHIRNVKAAANAEGIPHNQLRIIQTKSVANIISAAKKRMTVKTKRNAAATKKQERNQRIAELKRAAIEAGINETLVKIRGKQTANEVIAAARKRTQVKTTKQQRNEMIALMKRAAINAGVNEKDFKYTSKKTQEQLIQNAFKRKQARTKKNDQRSLKQQIIDRMGMPEAVLKAAMCSRAK